MNDVPLYIVATPIGNLEDITLRALKILENVDIIAAEDTRESKKLLDKYNISKKLISYHVHNEEQSAKNIINLILNGKTIALISDSGMPLISDPGYEIINLAHKNNIKISICPGANAAISALVLSGFSTRRFVFEGFLPSSKKDRTAIIESLKNEKRTVIFYEAPHRVQRFLKEFCDILGKDRKIAIIREITKVFEEIKIGTLGEMQKHYSENEPR